MSTEYVVCCSEPGDPEFDVIGPFESYDEALKWIEGYALWELAEGSKTELNCSVLPLLTPSDID